MSGRSKILRSLLAALLLSAGCAPRNHQSRARPPTVVQPADSWNTSLAGGVTAQPADLASWWTTLADPLLASLESRAVQGNLDLRRASSRVLQLRAVRDAAATQLQPTVAAGVSASANRSGARDATFQSYSAGLSASWEPDFFGRIRASIAAADADVDTAREDLRNVLVSLTAEVALNYVELRSYQAQLTVTRRNLETQQEIHRLTLARAQSGLATALDAEQARLTVESTRAAIPTLLTRIQQAANNIAVLLGERPGAITAELTPDAPIPSVPTQVAVGLPADLLRRRPDIRGAERQIAAQGARLGVARANLYPAFTLSGSLSFSSAALLDLLSPASRGAAVAGALQQTLFNRRRLREQVNVQDALLDQSIAAYEATVLIALQDVEDALIAYAQEQVRRQALAQAVDAAERSLALSRDLYTAGMKDFLSVLDSQRALLSLQNQAAQSDAAITTNLIVLYKSLGGGWQ